MTLRVLVSVILILAMQSLSPAQSWVEIGGSASAGGISGNAGDSSLPSIAIGSSGDAFVAWPDNSSGTYEIYLRHWDGSAWVELGGSATGSGLSFGTGYAAMPTVVLDGSGNPWVSWMDTTAPSIFVRHWTGSAWSGVGGSDTGSGLRAPTDGGVNLPHMAIDPSGHPVVTWSCYAGGNWEIYVKRWDGSAWVELAGSASGGGLSSSPGVDSIRSHVAICGDGNPAVGWEEVGSFSYIFLKKWDGAAWTELGGSGSGTGISGSAVNCYASWTAADGLGNPMVAYLHPRVGVTTSDIYFRLWNGTSWGELGGSGSGFGLRSPVDHFPNAVLARNGDGNPMIAWQEMDSSTANMEIFSVAWSGAAWVEVGNSIDAGGISTTAGDSRYPGIVCDPAGRTFVSWAEGASPSEIYLKEIDPPPPTFVLLEQRDAGGVTPIPSGGSTSGSSVVFAAIAGGLHSVGFEIEVQPVGTSFSGTSSAVSPFATAGTALTIALPVTPGSYHWQARWIDSAGIVYPWVSYGGNPEASPDFVVSTPSGGGGSGGGGAGGGGGGAGGGGSGGGGGGSGHHKRCGLTGFEVVPFLLTWCRRRTSRY